MICSPVTGEQMIKVGTVRRIVKEPDNSYYLLIPVYYSKSENRYHRVLPDMLLPFMHYTVETIVRSLNNDQDLDLHDLPSDSSRIRWKRQVCDLLYRLSELKHSDSFGSLPEPLLSSLIRGNSRLVCSEITFHVFIPEVLVRMVNLTERKRL